jgi:hypothetical protein
MTLATSCQSNHPDRVDSDDVGNFLPEVDGCKSIVCRLLDEMATRAIENAQLNN